MAATGVIVTAGTSAALEAVCYGIPVIIVGQPAGLDMNPLEAVDRRLWEIVYDAGELRRTLAAWTPSHPLALAERLILGQQIRDAQFAPLNEEGMAQFLPTPGLSNAVR